MGKRRSSFVASDDSGEERPAKASKKTAKGSSSSKGNDSALDADGNAFWELANSNKRRVTVSKFGGKWFIGVREYWEDKTGEMKPGKKGISLSVEQYQAFAELVPSINAQLRKNGVALAGDVIEDEGNDDEDEGEKPAKSTQKSATTKKTKVASKKANIEATSDEADGLEED